MSDGPLSNRRMLEALVCPRTGAGLSLWTLRAQELISSPRNWPIHPKTAFR